MDDLIQKIDIWCQMNEEIKKLQEEADQMGRLVSIKDGYTLADEEEIAITVAKSIIEATQKIPGNIVDCKQNEDGTIEFYSVAKSKEESKMKMFDKPLKVFVSQPMKGRKYIDIYTERQRAISSVLSYLKAQNIIPDDLGPDTIQIIDNYNKTLKIQDTASHKADRRVYLLGDSIQLMADASFVIFVSGYDQAKGCQVERTICRLYNIPTIWIMDDEKETIVLENFPK